LLTCGTTLHGQPSSPVPATPVQAWSATVRPAPRVPARFAGDAYAPCGATHVHDEKGRPQRSPTALAGNNGSRTGARVAGGAIAGAIGEYLSYAWSMEPPRNRTRSWLDTCAPSWPPRPNGPSPHFPRIPRARLDSCRRHGLRRRRPPGE
jgi:hypothetical protein